MRRFALCSGLAAFALASASALIAAGHAVPGETMVPAGTIVVLATQSGQAAPAGDAKPATPARPTLAGQRLAFDFKDPKGVNAVGFLLDSALEPIFGTGTDISGNVEFDPLDPKSASGVLVMSAKAVRTTNQRMTEVLHGADWLDVENHPTITINLLEVETVEPRSVNTFKIQARAEVEIKGQTRELSLPLLATYLPGRLGDRLRGASGDLLVLRSRFTVNRSDFAINVATSPEVVAEEILITASIVGSRKTG